MDAQQQEASENPYEPPRERSHRHSEPPSAVPNASLLWFAAAVFAVTVLGTLSQALLSDEHVDMSSRAVAGVSLISAVSAGAALLVFATVEAIIKRKCGATRASRLVAGIVFGAIMWLGLLFVIAIGFSGPPFVISAPIAAVVSTLVDRGLAQLAMANSRPDV